MNTLIMHVIMYTAATCTDTARRTALMEALAAAYLARLEMHATLCENLQVDTLSQILPSSADMVAIMAVRQFPPGHRES